MKTTIIAVIVTCLIIVACSFTIPACAESVDMPTIVVGSHWVEDDFYEVFCYASDGNIWAFLADCNEWERGDLAILTIEDGEVTGVFWDGYIELPFALLEWF